MHTTLISRGNDGTPRSVIIPTGELIESIIIPTLKPYIGVAALICDHVPILEAVLDDYLFDIRALPEARPKAIIQGYGIPNDPADYICNTLSRLIPAAVQEAFGIIYPHRHYRYEFTLQGDVMIHESQSGLPYAHSSSDAQASVCHPE